MASSTFEQVSITVPAEQRDAVRHALAEDIGVLADSAKGKRADMHRLSNILAKADGVDLRLEADTPGDRRTLRQWAEGAKKDGENTLGDLDSYGTNQEWWEHRSRSLIAIAEQVLEALGEEAAPSAPTEIPIVTFTRKQRDALLEQLYQVVYSAVDHSIDDLWAERQVVEDALELWGELEGERESYPVLTTLGEDPTGWDGTRRSFRLARLSRRLLEHTEEALASDAPRVDPEIAERDRRLAARSACVDVFKAMSPSGEGG